MEYFEQIHDFIEGALDSSQEEQLFLSMSSNEELRTEMKHQFAIKDAVRTDVKAFTPSPASTMKIFGNLGFQAPASIIPTASHGIIKPLLAKYGVGLGAGLFSAVTTAAIIFLFFIPHNGTSISNINKENRIENNQITNEKQNNIVPNIASSETNTRNFDNNHTRTIVKYIYVKQNGESKNQIMLQNSNNNLVQNENKLIDNLLPNRYLINRAAVIIHDVARFNSQQVNVPMQSNLTPDFIGTFSYGQTNNIGLQLELRNSENWFSHPASISPAQFAKFNNTGVSIFYSLSDFLSIGLDLRQETFFQQFTGNDSIGNTYLYEQQPNLTTKSLVARSNFGHYGIFSPYAQLSAGVNNAGLTSRGSLGLVIKAYPGLSFILGAELNNLTFKHSNKNYNTSKTGFNYGIVFNF